MKGQNIPTYMNNKLINSMYATNIYDQNFYQQTQLQKEEQLRKIKNISDLGLSKEQITEYVISPIKVEKTDAKQIEVLRSECSTQYKKEYIENNWWKHRTNAPYKNILKDQNWKKNFKSNADLIDCWICSSVFSLNSDLIDCSIIISFNIPFIIFYLKNMFIFN